MYSANPIGSLLAVPEQRGNPFQSSGGLRSPSMLLEGGSGLWRTPAFGEQHSLHISRVLENTCAFQRLASRRATGHGSRLFQRHQRLDLQILPESSLGLLVHPKKIGAGSSSVCSVPNVGTQIAVDWGQLPPRGTKSRACRFQFWRCPNEQREAYRRSASADGLGIAQADRQTLERQPGKGAAIGSVKTRSGKMA